ncbi:TonB-dependent receptor, partial [bacterium]|nr:TonB-dependent receptor [bacterium]
MKCSLHINFFLVTFILLPAIGIAGSISGFVRDATSSEPLPAANIVVVGEKRGASTNLDGFFIISELEPGSFTLHITHLGYHSREYQVFVKDMNADPLQIDLLPATMELDEVVFEIQIDEEQQLRESARVSTVPVSGSTIRKLPSLGAEMDLLRALQTIPGVKASSDINSSLYVRGGSPDMTLILLDHSTVYNPAHFFGLFSTFNTDAVKHIELMKGGFPAKYGGRAGSVLEVVTKEGNREEFQGMAHVGVISTKAMVEGALPGKNGSYALSGRRTYLEPTIAAIRNNSDLEVPDYYFYDGNAKINLDISDRTTVTLAGYMGWDDMRSTFGSETNEIHYDVLWGNRTLTTRLRSALQQNLYFSAGIVVSDYESGWSYRSNDIVLDEAENRFSEISLRSDLEISGNESHKIETGMWLSRYDVIFQERNDNYTFIDVDSFTYNYSAYLQDTWTVTDAVEIQGGIRGYYHHTGSWYRYDPRLAIRYKHSPTLRFKAATGRYTQWIHLITIGEGGSNFDIWIPVDDSINPAFTYQYVAGVEWDFRSDYQSSFEVYYNDMHDISTLDPMADQGTKSKDAFFVGEGFAYGF